MIDLALAHPDVQREPSIAKSEQAVEDAIAAYRNLVESIQVDCEHRVVFQSNFCPHPDHRICPRCGLEEIGYTCYATTAVWNCPKFKAPVLGNDAKDRIVVRIDDREKFYSFRVAWSGPLA